MNIIQATPEHIPMIIAELSADDAHEVAQLGQCPRATAEYTLSASSQAYVWIEAGKPILMFGVMAPMLMLSSAGMIWMVATRELKRHLRQFIAAYPYWLAKMSEGFESVECQVHGSLKTTLRIIERAGFNVTHEKEYGQAGSMFKHCVKGN